MMTTEAYARFACDWVHCGATIIGGCCGVGPDHITAVVAALSAGISSPSDLLRQKNEHENG